ncbi:SH3 domain-containing protein [Tumidithrix helvetica PCC 7403]|uniref:SH3 domain-containing protein n=1 Tax=Tumidithrix helvetica TaxID=3457545 RepID=UPI003CB62D5C
MKRIISKLLVLAIGVSLSVVAVEATSIESAMAQRLCQSYRVTRDGGLYVYINAGSEIITTLPYGNIVRVTGMSSDGEWARIEYLRVDGQTGEGWVASSYLSCYQE